MSARLLALACVLCFCQWAERADAASNTPFIPPWEREWRKQISDALAKKVTTDVDKKPLSEAVESIREQAGVTIIIDPATEGGDKPKLISVKVKDTPLADVLKQMTTQAGLDFDPVFGVIFIYNHTKVDKELFRPDDFLIGKMLDGREERLNYEMKDSLAGDAMKELTETPNIALPMDEQLKQKKLTMKLTGIGLGNAIRWVVRLSGGRIMVDKENMRIIKRDAAPAAKN